jgi:hypothetical protein
MNPLYWKREHQIAFFLAVVLCYRHFCRTSTSRILHGPLLALGGPMGCRRGSEGRNRGLHPPINPRPNLELVTFAS